jgi:hypothetical protein
MLYQVVRNTQTPTTTKQAITNAKKAKNAKRMAGIAVLARCARVLTLGSRLYKPHAHLAALMQFLLLPPMKDDIRQNRFRFFFTVNRTKCIEATCCSSRLGWPPPCRVQGRTSGSPCRVNLSERSRNPVPARVLATTKKKQEKAAQIQRGDLFWK